MIRNLQQFDFYLIRCDEHPDKKAHMFCKEQNKMVCSRCLQSNPHLHFIKDHTQHFSFERKYLDESFQKMLPILKEEMNQIQILMDNIHQFINKERNFRVLELKMMIEKNFKILSQSYKKIILKKNEIEEEKQQPVVFDQIKPSQSQPLINKTQEQYTPGIMIQSIISAPKISQEQDNAKQNEFRRLVDQCLELQKVQKGQRSQPQKLFQIKGKSKLIFRATRDGFKALNFHQSCDNMGPTISFIMSEHGQVFGGYTSVSWTNPDNKKGVWLKDSEAFLFSLSKNTIHQQYKFPDQALRHHKDVLIAFGRGNDIRINDDCNNNRDSLCNLGGTFNPQLDYKWQDQQAQEHLAGSYQFKVIEIEVYSIQQ
ncbi:tldc domain-containing protein [Stylonychia lemnae]|uniref:Tldc domain-containing protein n=1 Tax=Stylonychia lemnae TaxID=5949 RepID=A0A078A8P1_STYLE|nr:tldc domain-containing protein [Stylonychia lemnae]|eukprot:CDW78645.1 tldc domain-containing protein [Stylonychia lemnae]